VGFAEISRRSGQLVCHRRASHFNKPTFLFETDIPFCRGE
jgi:hypothetical protein